MSKDAGILWMDSIDSTNSEIKRQSDVLGNLSAIAAVRQTDGRGQGTHKWVSSPGENLTFSILLRFSDIAPLAASDSLLITQAAALSVVDELRCFGMIPRIKWPNDVYVGNGKICGILIENTLSAGMVVKSIVGIGLNVNQTNFPKDIPNPVSIASVTGEKNVLSEVMERLYAHIVRRVGMIASPEGREALDNEFSPLVFRRGA